MVGNAPSFVWGGRSRLRGAVALALIPLSLTIGACTHLAVGPDRLVTADRSTALPGATYSLPMLQYDLKLQRTVTACPEEVSIPGSGGSQSTFWTGDLAINLEVTAVANQIPGERYWIDYSKLDSWMKTTSFNLEYQPGGTDLLKSVNVSVEDHTGEVVGNVVKAGIAVAGVAAGPAGTAAAAGLITATSVPDKASVIADLNKSSAFKALTTDRQQQMILREFLRRQHAQAQSDEALRGHLKALVAAASERRTILTCTKDVVDKLNGRKRLAEKLKADNKTLEDATAAVEAMTKLAAVRALNPTRRDALANDAESMLAAGKAVADGKKAIADIEEELGVTKTQSWPSAFSDSSTDNAGELSAADTKKLTGLFVAAPVAADVIKPNELAAALAKDAHLAGLRRIAKEFVNIYVDDKGNPKPFKVKPQLPPCAGPGAKLDSCLTGLTTIQAKIEPVASDMLPGCTGTNAPECLTRYTAPAANAKGEAPARGEEASLPKMIVARGDGMHSGLFVRPPVRAILTICRKPAAGETSDDGYCAPGTSSLVKDDKVLAPQLGQLRYFRLVNQAFSNNGLQVSLTKDGAIEKFQYASSKSIAQGLSAAAADAATQAAAFDKARRDEAAKNSDPVAALQKQIDLVTAQQKLASLTAVKSPSEAEQIALAQAKADLLFTQAQIAYTAAQTAVFNSKAADQ